MHIVQVMPHICHKYHHIILIFTFLAIEIELKSIKEGPRELRHTYEAIVGTFRVGELNLNLINTKIGSTVGFDVNDVNFKLEEFIPNNEVTLVLGEFSCISDSFGKITFLILKFFFTQ